MAGSSFESIGRYLGENFVQSASQNGLTSSTMLEMLHTLPVTLLGCYKPTLTWIGLSLVFRYLSFDVLLSFVNVPIASAEGQDLSTMQRSILMMTDIAVILTIIFRRYAAWQSNLPQQPDPEASFRQINRFWTWFIVIGGVDAVCSIVYALILIFNLSSIIFSATMSLCTILYFRGLIRDWEVALVAFFASANAGVAVVVYCLARNCLLDLFMCFTVVSTLKAHEVLQNGQRIEIPYADDPPSYSEITMTDPVPDS
ncbi:uncharacterized protein LOC129585307 [Paramacrobiotus metropolitanus]|uniref:uncharacterized protein LOC129585307 n=1 Tax=Paramacrobiotus metropolitanus TaxID=2943436 RepID=UPI002445797C|nr:uncharacterized protein LOC129585307 [Paramacrobiotus metropolitanus]